jgi:hypothetical protein
MEQQREAQAAIQQLQAQVDDSQLQTAPNW